MRLGLGLEIEIEIEIDEARGEPGRIATYQSFRDKLPKLAESSTLTRIDFWSVNW